MIYKDETSIKEENQKTWSDEKGSIENGRSNKPNTYCIFGARTPALSTHHN